MKPARVNHRTAWTAFRKAALVMLGVPLRLAVLIAIVVVCMRRA